MNAPNISYKIFLFFFYILAFALPLSEAIKQVAIFGIIISGISYIYITKKSIKKDLSFYAGIIYIFSSIISIFFSFDTLKAFRGMLDVFKIVTVFLIIRNIYLETKIITNFILIIFLSFIIALIWGEYNLVLGTKDYLELKSIGHVNHSAIYIGIIFIISYSLFFFYKDKNYFLKYLSLIVLISACYGLIVSGSRAAIFATFFILLIISIFEKLYLNRKQLLMFVLIILVSVITLITHKYSLHKIQLGVFYDSGRIDLWVASIKAYLDNNIFFGIGAKNSYFINPKIYIPDIQFTKITHSHNTFITILLEKGLFGLVSYILFILGIFLNIIHNTREKFLKIIAIGVFTLNLIISIVNTTFHNENGLLMAILWALAIQKK